MQLDIETIRWILSAFFVAGGTVISALLARSVNKMDYEQKKHDQRITDAHSSINAIKLHVAETYVSKSDLEKQLETHLSPIRDDMRDIKDDIKSLLKRP